MLKNLLTLATKSIMDPARSATDVLEIRFPLRIVVEMAVLVVVLSAIAAQVFSSLVPLPEDESGIFFQVSQRFPFYLALFQGAVLGLLAGATFLIGRVVGGTGGFKDTLLLMVWLHFVMLLIQIVQMVATIFLPVFNGILAAISLGLFFWLFVNFVTVLHGFRSKFKVLVGTIVAMFLLGIGLVNLFIFVIPS